MDALRSLLNPPRIETNRRNAAQSTGPKTAAGKAASRRNALKHGLTGAGLALPGEDESAVAERFAAFHDQFQPATPLGAYYVHRMALATVRTERLERHETAALTLRVRHAADEFDRARAVEADAALAQLRLGEGRAARRDLLGTPEGIDRLLGELAGLRRCLALPEPLWSREHGARLDACLGVAPDPIIPSRVEALTVAALGIANDLLTHRDLAAIAEAEVAESVYAVRLIAGLIDQEVAALRTDLAAIDPAEIALDRAGAADRALFDPSPAAQLARRYEAAARRELDRSLRLLGEVETAAAVLDAPLGETMASPDVPSFPEVKSDLVEPINGSESNCPNSPPVNDLPSDLASFGASGAGAAGPGSLVRSHEIHVASSASADQADAHGAEVRNLCPDRHDEPDQLKVA